MFKKFFTYPVFLVLFLSFIGLIIFGSILRHHYLGGKRFPILQDVAIVISEIPKNVGHIIKYKNFNLNKPAPLLKHKQKKRFERFIQKQRNVLLILPRYDNTLNRSVVDVIDLNNFETIHTYKHDIAHWLKQVKNREEFPEIMINNSPIRFQYKHPLILKNGSLISNGGDTPEFKIDVCSKLEWINDEEMFHHSRMLDHDGNLWVPGHMNPKSKHVIKYDLEEFDDDSIIKISIDGKILYNKSVIEILIENKILPINFALNSYLTGDRDPIHLNDIEPALSDTQYWKKGDLFLSIRNQSAIIHYRPSINKIINYITGPFSQQHDIDIISDKEISIFNNNNFLKNNEHSEILIYDFETDNFRKLFNDKIKRENFKTRTNGLSDILKDGSLIIEETIHGRIILFNKNGEKEWEFVNKDKNGEIGRVNWFRIIEDEIFIKNFKMLLKNKKCIN